jgi:hypothetical protein
MKARIKRKIAKRKKDIQQFEDFFIEWLRADMVKFYEKFEKGGYTFPNEAARKAVMEYKPKMEKR